MKIGEIAPDMFFQRKKLHLTSTGHWIIMRLLAAQTAGMTVRTKLKAQRHSEVKARSCKPLSRPWDEESLNSVPSAALRTPCSDPVDTTADIMAQRISQETFDMAVTENVEEFDMSPEEALADAIEQFRSQGVDLSNIVTEGGESKVSEPISVPVVMQRLPSGVCTLTLPISLSVGAPRASASEQAAHCA